MEEFKHWQVAQVDSTLQGRGAHWTDLRSGASGGIPRVGTSLEFFGSVLRPVFRTEANIKNIFYSNVRSMAKFLHRMDEIEESR
jgi:hypothetical protein